MAFVKGGKVKALAVTTRERMAELPDIPTMHELGWKNLVTSSWQGVLVHQPRRAESWKLHAAIVKVLPSLRSRPACATPRDRGRQQVAGGVQGLYGRETAKWTKVIQEKRRACGLSVAVPGRKRSAPLFARSALQSRGRNERRCLVRSRLCRAA